METTIHEINGPNIAEISADDVVINNVQDALDLMVNIGYRGAEKIIIHEKCLPPDFFNLSTGLAGEILQKFSNYKMELAVVGDFSKYAGKSFDAFMVECNRGNLVYFASNVDNAIQRLSE